MLKLSCIHIPHNKNTEKCTITDISLPKTVKIPMSMNMGAPCNPLVKVGDEVAVGQKIGDTDAFLSVPVHSGVSGKVIATGGGCVTQERNYDLLHQNGDIYWIHRDLADLSTEGRPLSQKANLKEMYRVRVPMYNRFKDWNIMNNGSPEEAARQIIHIWENER